MVLEVWGRPGPALPELQGEDEEEGAEARHPGVTPALWAKVYTRGSKLPTHVRKRQTDDLVLVSVTFVIKRRGVWGVGSSVGSFEKSNHGPFFLFL